MSGSSPRAWSSSASPASNDAAIRELLERRKQTQPIGEWSCGSVFTNPPGEHAARLIESAGLKGFRIGDASVSEKHANFIINHGAARAADIEALILHVQRTVAAVAQGRARDRSAHRGGAGMSLLKAQSGRAPRERAAEFGKVAVLLGGDSTEREISLLSGNAVLTALEAPRRRCARLRSGRAAVQELVSEGFDRAWNALHGPGGEDGLMQGALEWLGIPYTGSGVLASALTMDKLKTKRVVVGAGLAAPDYAVLSGPADLPRALADIGLPMMVKPASQGSSVGITKVKAAAELARAYAEARRVDPIVFAEALHRGRRIHGGRAAGSRSAVDSHRARDRVLRLRGEVFPRRHAVSLPERTR